MQDEPPHDPRKGGMLALAAIVVALALVVVMVLIAG